MIGQKKEIKSQLILLLAIILAVIVTVLYFSGLRPVLTMVKNEQSVMDSLKSMLSTEACWRALSMSGTGKSDYWTYDVSGLYRKIKEDGVLAQFISIDLAKADGKRHKDGIFGKGVTQDWDSIYEANPVPKSGYYFRAMESDEKGAPYNQNNINKPEELYHTAEPTGLKVANDYEYAFVAYPAEYGKTGKLTFIMSQNGAVYAKDTKGEAILDWPGKNPETEGWSPVPWHWEKSAD